jgi:hypothetical protein
MRAAIKEFLDEVVELARARFGGKVSYASLSFEGVSWERFDIISRPRRASAVTSERLSRKAERWESP